MGILITILSILIILILALILLLFLKFSVILSTEGKNIRLFVKVLGIKINIPLNKTKDEEKKKKEKSQNPKKPEKSEENEESVLKKFLDLRNNFNRMKKALELALIYLRKRIEIDDFGVMGEFGAGNAASTGMAYGMVNAFVNTVFGFLGQYFSIKKPPSIAVRLNYDKAVFDINFAFMIKTKLWYLLKAFLIFKNNVKER